MASYYIGAWVFLGFSCLAALFQLALAAGLPWGHLAMGGKFPGRYPAGMRAVCLMLAVVVLAIAAVVMTRAGIILPAWFPMSKELAWVVVAYCLLGCVLNLATPSKWERILWAPVTVVMLVCSLLVATS